MWKNPCVLFSSLTLKRIGSISSINNRIVIAQFLSIAIPPGQQLPKRWISEFSRHSPSPSLSSSPILIQPPLHLLTHSSFSHPPIGDRPDAQPASDHIAHRSSPHLCFPVISLSVHRTAQICKQTICPCCSCWWTLGQSNSFSGVGTSSVTSRQLLVLQWNASVWKATWKTVTFRYL